MIDTGTGRLLTLHVYNANASERYLQIFDASAVPADGAVPLIETKIAGKTTGKLSWSENGLPYTDGMFAALSSTDASLTLVEDNDGLFCAVTDYEREHRD